MNGWFTEPRRAAIYRLALALIAAATAFDLIAPDQSDAIAEIVQAAGGLLVASLAVKNTSRPTSSAVLHRHSPADPPPTRDDFDDPAGQAGDMTPHALFAAGLLATIPGVLLAIAAAAGNVDDVPSWYWAGWLVCGFLAVEVVSLSDARDPDGTLSATVWDWFAVREKPRTGWRKTWATVRRWLLLIFLAWLLVHLTTAAI